MTEVEVRYVMENWEIFIVCHGNGSDSGVGQESVSLFFTGLDDTVVILPTPSVRSDFPIFTQTTDVGWSARVVVPNSLIKDGKLSFSVVRTHGENKNVETSPLPCVPWDVRPAPVVIDTTHWNTIDNISITPESK